jgi:hypothetical protein
MRLRELTALIVLLVFGISATELGTVTNAWLRPASASNGSLCPLHSKCLCPESCKLQKPKAKASCHTSAATDSSPNPLPSPSCFLKAGCGQRDAVTHASNSLKDSWLQPLEGFYRANHVFQLMGFSVKFPRLGFIPLPFHPPKTILSKS